MRLRSLLFVPGDRPDRMAKALGSGADALILDLEDSVAPDAKDSARAAVRSFLGSADRKMPLFVRINPLDGAAGGADLAAILPATPDGIVLPKAQSGADVAALDSSLGQGERPLILPIVTETSASIFGLGSYAGSSTRLCGLTWGAEDLPAAIGASTSREADGSFTEPYRVVRSLALFGAHAAGVCAIETVYPNFSDPAGLLEYARRGFRDGFSGMLAIHPSQVPIINAAFTPDPASIERARAVVDLFAANPGAGALSLDGRMIDRPHLVLAQRLLAAADQERSE